MIMGPGSIHARALKRTIDLAVAVPACLLLAPLFAILAVAIKLDSAGPVFFVQKRRGLRMREFSIVKFRSLAHGLPDPHARYEMQGADPRITRVGDFLRRTSLDELPQLFNVVAGSMSLVGPRPLVEWESQECVARHAERFEVKPGITGLSQITVRNAAGFFERVELDVEYVRHWSLGLDLALLLRTPRYVLSSRGIYSKA